MVGVFVIMLILLPILLYTNYEERLEKATRLHQKRKVERQKLARALREERQRRKLAEIVGENSRSSSNGSNCSNRTSVGSSLDVGLSNDSINGSFE